MYVCMYVEPSRNKKGTLASPRKYITQHLQGKASCWSLWTEWKWELQPCRKLISLVPGLVQKHWRSGAGAMDAAPRQIPIPFPTVKSLHASSSSPLWCDLASPCCWSCFLARCMHSKFVDFRRHWSHYHVYIFITIELVKSFYQKLPCSFYHYTQKYLALREVLEWLWAWLFS